MLVECSYFLYPCIYDYSVVERILSTTLSGLHLQIHTNNEGATEKTQNF